jgi:hypothetical protein
MTFWVLVSCSPSDKGIVPVLSLLRILKYMRFTGVLCITNLSIAFQSTEGQSKAAVTYARQSLGSALRFLEHVDYTWNRLYLEQALCLQKSQTEFLHEKSCIGKTC